MTVETTRTEHLSADAHYGGIDGNVCVAPSLHALLDRIAALEEALAGLIDAVNWYHGNALGDPYDERKWLVVLDAKDGATTFLPDYRYAAPARTPVTASKPQEMKEDATHE